MIDPNFLTVFPQSVSSRARGRYHRAAFQLREYVQLSRRRFKSGKSALSYAEKVVKRWKRLYSALMK